MTKDQAFNNVNKVKPSQVGVSSGTKFLGATFLYMSLALALTFAIVGIMGGLLRLTVGGSDTSGEILGALLIVGVVLYIPVLIWVQIAAIRQGKSVGVAFFAYSIVMGILIAPVCLAVDISTLLIALGTTCLSFGAMALIAWQSKKDLSTLGVIGSGLLIGALFIALFNTIFYFFVPTLYAINYIAIEGIFFIAVILITIFDLNRVKQVAMNNYATKNLALLCALNLYVDFIYIFIRLLRLIAIVRQK